VEPVAVTRGLLSSLESYERGHGSGPTVEQLGDVIGLPPEYRHVLGKMLRRELSLGRVSYLGGRYRLTAVARARLDGDRLPDPAA